MKLLNFMKTVSHYWSDTLVFQLWSMWLMIGWPITGILAMTFENASLCVATTEACVSHCSTPTWRHRIQLLLIPSKGKSSD